MARGVFPELAHAEIEQVNYPRNRCYPVDSKPIVGFVTGGPCKLYIAVMHSGVTLGPLMGQLIAEEVQHESEPPEFQPYRITRDFGDVTHKY